MFVSKLPDMYKVWMLTVNILIASTGSIIPIYYQ